MCLGIDRITSYNVCYTKLLRLFFEDKIWEITAAGVKEINYGQFPEYIWKEKIIPYKVKAIPDFISVTQLTPDLKRKLDADYSEIDDGEFFIDYSAPAKDSHFLQFLINTSVITSYSIHYTKLYEDQ